MGFIPQEELQSKERLSLAPMIDFLFLLLMFFATLAVSRVAAKDTDINLVKIEPETKISPVANQERKIITLNIDSNGSYKWVTEMKDYPLASAKDVADELESQHQQGLLPYEKGLTHILLRIDRQAMWEPILKLLFAIREAGFDVHPVYEPETQEVASL